MAIGSQSPSLPKFLDLNWSSLEIKT